MSEGSWCDPSSVGSSTTGAMRTLVLGLLLLVACAEGFTPVGENEGALTGAAGQAAPMPVDTSAPFGPADPSSTPTMSMPEEPGMEADPVGDGSDADGVPEQPAADVDCNDDASACDMLLECCRSDGTCGTGLPGLCL